MHTSFESNGEEDLVRSGRKIGLKILLGVHVFFPKNRAGTEVLTLELARGLRKRGHSVQIIAGEREEHLPEKSSPWLTEDRYDDFPIHRIHYGVSKLRDPITNDINAPQRISLAMDVVSRWQPDVVHFNHLIGFSAQIIPEIRRMGIPVIFTPTDYWLACPKAILYRAYDKNICDGPGENAVDCLFCLFPMPKWVGKLAWKISSSPLRNHIGPLSSLHSLTKRTKSIAKCVNTADKVFPATNFLANILARHGVDENHMKIIPYGVDVGNLPEEIPVPQKFSRETPLRLGFIGHLSEFKGAHVILDALHLLKDRCNLLTLLIYGKLKEGDSYSFRLQGKAREICDTVYFKGIFSHEKIGEILRGFHCLVVPSLWYESTPLVLCSALESGTPVLVSRLGGMTEIVEEGVDGITFPAGNAFELSSIISKILDSPKILNNLRNSLRKRNRSVADYICDMELEYLHLHEHPSRKY